eukprot:CAMPEP_0175884824 /NCGR_PEP_ID=MMETSP0107_2-20121207/44733_2 /TAXON_ID=195067 ORGANISM="Goniomonas pacifica, Strain CCMP1869" /NCGR_SAMPLE_ID=MMETSP0107_2 /ASSEMBLY_ACC=CAM_ASM_000203 /LENGTH=65 /DNA_ID=CAMNT_0017205013 /DNA_START=240 /DNA_END=437 /DNA_ORIENTATION=-
MTTWTTIINPDTTERMSRSSSKSTCPNRARKADRTLASCADDEDEVAQCRPAQKRPKQIHEGKDA